jgi:uncharacterized cupin superfamily protein
VPNDLGMQQLSIGNAYMWSRWQPDRKMYFNSHFFVLPEGNVAVDPVPLEAGDIEEITALGGVASVVITNRDHLRDAVALRERFGARVITSEREASLLDIPVHRVLRDGEEVFSGARTVLLSHQKTPGEFAIHLRRHRAVLVGDAIFGAPAGSLSLPADKMYDDVQRALLSLRRLASLQPEILLVGDGASLWSGATRAIEKLLFARGGIAVNRINVDELEWETDEAAGGKYRSTDGEVGFWIGARRLGYQVVKLPPGARFCPVHAEYSEEELFVVLDGTPSIRTTKETLQCRRGDFIAFPTGPDHAHQVINESAAEATLLLLGEASDPAICYYPTSDKVLVAAWGERWMMRRSPQLDYYDGE